MANQSWADFQCGDFSEAGATSGTVSVQTTTVRPGQTYAMRCNPTTTGTGLARVYGLAADGSSGASAVSIDPAFCSVYFQFLTAPAAADEEFLSFYDTGGSPKMTLRLTSAGKIAAYDSTPTLMQTGTTVLSSGTWYRIEAKCANNTEAWEVKLATGNGASASEIGRSGLDALGNTNAGSVYLGKANNRNGQTVDFYYTDCVWGTSAYIGAGTTALLVATADGHYTSGTANGAATKWQCLTQLPSDGDTTYIDGLLATQAYTAKAGGIPATSSVLSVKGQIIIRDLAGAGASGMRVRSGATDTDTTSRTNSNSYESVQKIFDTDPNTSAAWTKANVNLAEVGLIENTAGNRLTAAFLHVYYVPTASGSSSSAMMDSLGMRGAV